MAGLLERAREQAQRGYTQGRHKLDEMQAQRAGHALLKRLGAAYYAQEHGTGTAEGTRQALDAVERHKEEHGDTFLRT